MKIQLTTSKTIGQVQDEFREAYPFLDLAFFSRPHRPFRGSPSEFQITDRRLTLGHLREINHEGIVYLEPDRKTWQIERLFEIEFGLHVQVLRKSGDQWLVTSTTDDLTLDDQNTRGRDFKTSNIEPEDAIDYREQD